MAAHTASKSSVSSGDESVGRKVVSIFREQYKKARLEPERVQRFIGNKAFADGLLDLISRCSLTIKIPESGRLYVVHAPVDPGRDLQEAMEAATYHDPRIYIQEDKKKSPQPRGDTVDQEVILVCFGGYAMLPIEAKEWGKQYGLVEAEPLSLFAVVEHRPNLNIEIGMKYLAIFSASIERSIPYVWWDDGGHFAEIGKYTEGFGDSIWFAFSRA